MVIFETPGQLDIRALSVFGLSSKNSDQIGRFGTGFKYALAVILRNGGQVKIAGAQEYSFSVQKDNFRGTEYSQILINGEPLSFTTDLGREWQTWMAFRELYSNTLDEGGRVFFEPRPQFSPDRTYVCVSGAGMEALFFDLDAFFISPEDTPIWEDEKVAIYPGRSKFLFNKGIAVQELEDSVAEFRYNYKGYTQLTEDRTTTYKRSIPTHIAEALVSCDNETVLRRVLNADLPFEGKLEYIGTPSAAFEAITRKQNAPVIARKLVATQDAHRRRLALEARMPEHEVNLNKALIEVQSIYGNVLDDLTFAVGGRTGGNIEEVKGTILVPETKLSNPKAATENIILFLLRHRPMQSARVILRYANMFTPFK